MSLGAMGCVISCCEDWKDAVAEGEAGAGPDGRGESAMPLAEAGCAMGVENIPVGGCAADPGSGCWHSRPGGGELGRRRWDFLVRRGRSCGWEGVSSASDTEEAVFVFMFVFVGLDGCDCDDDSSVAAVVEGLV